MAKALVALVLFLMPVAAHAESAATLEKSKADEVQAAQAGVEISKENTASYKRYLPAALQVAIDHGLRVKVAPTKRLEWSEGFKKATEKYSAQVRLDENDYLVNYVAGAPFPLVDLADPKVAVKIAYNWHMGPFMPDDFALTPWSSNAYSFDTANPNRVHPQSADEYACDEFDFLRFAHRTEIEPRPTFGNNTMGLEWKAKCNRWIQNGLGTSINEGAGVWARFLDPHHSDEFFGFSEASRRVRRSAVTLEYPSEGCRSCHQPYWAYALPKTETYTYRLIGTRSIYACINAAEEPAGLTGSGDLMTLTPEPFERRHAYTIEMTPKDPNVVSRRAIIDIDSEIYVWLASEFYEGAQRTAVAIPLWRRRPSPEGGSLFDLAGNFYVRDGTNIFRSLVPADGHFDQKINSGAISPQIFNPQNLGR